VDHQDGIGLPPSIGEIVLGAIDPGLRCDIYKAAAFERFG
jgi:hypothetical protein